MKARTLPLVIGILTALGAGSLFAAEEVPLAEPPENPAKVATPTAAAVGGGIECPLDGYKSYVQTFEPPVDVPDNDPGGVLLGPIPTPPDGSTMLDVVVQLNMSHTWVGDLVACLYYIPTACGDLGVPLGACSVALIDRPGVPHSTFGCSGDLVGGPYFFGDAGGGPLGEPQDQCFSTFAPGCYRPAPESPNPLSVFDGHPKQGCWWLRVSDNAGADLGSISGWAVHVQNEQPHPVLCCTHGVCQQMSREACRAHGGTVVAACRHCWHPPDHYWTAGDERELALFRARQSGRVELLPAEPNPFRDAARVAYALPTGAPVRLSVYDVSGRVVARLVDGEQPAGVHEATWIVGERPSGVYFFRLEAGGEVRMERATLSR